ncbi:MAG: winged helix DNA-binding domain-containing protein [Chloroflexi bacterium]|nr:winged helix DNA-binding domain-containing protein [Chloroflexota bacterium]
MDLDEALEKHRAEITKKHRVRNADALVKLVDDVGFCFAFTLRTGDAPLPACFDHLSTTDQGRKWGWMWEWKDELSEAKRVYYGTFLVRKPTFVSLKMLPAFYAMFGRVGEPDEHLDDVRAGRISDVGRRVLDYLAQRGETQTKRMRAELGIGSRDGRIVYDKAIDELQRLMYIARVRAVGDDRESYNYTYDLFTKRYPETVNAAERISSADACARVLGRALELAGALTQKQITKLLDWDDERVARTVAHLESAKKLARHGEGKSARFVLPAVLARIR